MPVKELPDSVHLTHPGRIVDASTGITKLDVMRYYVAATPRLLEHLRGRPVALVRAPDGLDGARFFQKHLSRLRVRGIKQLDRALDPGNEPMLEIANVEALLGSVQMNVLEFHTWNASVRSIEKPDRLVFDLDPGKGVGWMDVCEAAMRVRAALQDYALESFLKTSGGRGLHVVVPLRPRAGWDSVRAFALAIVQRLAQNAPDRFAAKSGARNRVGRIFIDYLRNGRGATTVAAWSARARPGLGVSVPVAWHELEILRSADQWNVRNATERLLNVDPWAAYASSRRALPAAVESRIRRSTNATN